jgi:hypothetical protein
MLYASDNALVHIYNPVLSRSYKPHKAQKDRWIRAMVRRLHAYKACYVQKLNINRTSTPLIRYSIASPAPASPPSSVLPEDSSNQHISTRTSKSKEPANMPAHQHPTTQQGKGKGKAKEDRVPILSNPALESWIAESDPKSPKKPNWSERLLQKLITLPRELTDEDYTLCIGKPTEKAWVEFRPGSGPYVIILHGNKSSSCE